MGKWARRIAIATAVSVGIHLGIAGGLQYSLPERAKQTAPLVEQKPKMNVPPLEERQIGAKPEEKKGAKVKKPDLEGLAQEKSRFVEETLLKLNGGKKIRLSEFFIRAEALDRNIQMAEKGEFGPKESEMREKYFEIVEKANTAVLWEEDEIAALHKFMHTKVLAGYFWESGSMLDVLERGWYNCASSTEFFSALLQDVLGKEKFEVLLFDDHLANVIGKKRIDAVNPEWEKTNAKFDGCGLVVPPDIFIAAYLRNNGIDLEEMPKRLAKHYDAQRSWPGCPTLEKNINDANGARNSYSMPKPGAKSGLRVPSVFVPNPKYEASTEQVVKMARALFAAYQFAQEKNNKKSVEENPKPRKVLPQTAQMNGSIELILMKPLSLPKDVNWGEILEMFKDEFDANIMIGLWKEKLACIYPFASIPPETIPDMLGSMPKKEAEKWKYYSRESICKRMEKAAEFGTISDIWNYQSFHFCPGDFPEVNEAIKRRYLQDRNGDVLRFSLGAARVPDNFDFFLNEFLNAASLDIKRKAAAGMLFSKNGKACGILKGLSESQRLELSQQIVLGCADEGIAWKVTELRNSYTIEELSALGALDGGRLTKKQCEFIEQKAATATLNAKIELARIIIECGNKEAGLKIAREFVDAFRSGDPTRSLGEGYFPMEMNPVFAPLLDSDRSAFGVSKGMFCNGGRAEYEEKIIGALRRAVKNKEADSKKRIEAAYLLLQMGAEPVQEQ